jgi:hypothetical protein
VIQRTDAGAADEDTVAHLSETEREVTGLVFALAGYLVHTIYDTVPVMLLDSLEASDADRIAALVEYIANRAGYFVVALPHGQTRRGRRIPADYCKRTG